jgi:HEPN domain-containing protein
MTKQDIKKLFEFFTESSARDLSTFKSLKRLKRYDAALFFLHLAIEKQLKALLLKKLSGHPPLSHDLVYLIGRTGIEVSESFLADLRVLTTFNIQTRYENEKFEFHKLATKEFVAHWERKGKLVLKWIQEQQKHN